MLMLLRIAEIRRERGLQQAELAEAAGLRAATISEIETGKENPRLETLERIAEVLRVHVRDLFPDEVDDASAHKLAKLILSLDEPERAALETLVRRNR